MTAPLSVAASPWWRGATIYQIYPRSFADADGDGIGDLAGATAHLDHVASLGVDMVWLSPFYVSPMADFGYDVADYRDVDPVFGTLADFDAFVARARELGLKVMIDLVFAHSSDRHAWFVESRSSRSNPRADWYVWADAKADGTPPSNWQSVFGGPAWTWDARRQQYYLHTFLKAQPQLNFHNPAVQAALLDVVRFWIERGVDGFRFDAINHAMADAGLADNPPAPDDGSLRTRPFDFQRKVHSQNHPGVVAFLEDVRALCDAHGTLFSVAEVGGADADPLMKAYTSGEDRLTSAYSFEFLYAQELTAAGVAAALARWPGLPGADGRQEGWPSWAFENHDAPRHVSRWVADAHRPAFARMTMALFAALRGNVFLYQGQELALEQDDIPFHLLQDPEAIANWPLTLSRDGVRTPMPWRALAPHAGFTTGTPWLPLSAGNTARSVDAQEADPASQLHWTRRVLALRQASPALREGACEDLRAEGPLLCFTRRLGGEAIACRFNLGAAPLPLVPVAGEVLLAVNDAVIDCLPPYAALLVRCA